MKIAALADIHGNYRALITVLNHVERWNPDLVMVLGDIINRGPRSRECLHLIQEMEKSADWQLIQGNHEGYVLNFSNPDTPLSGLRYETQKIIHWTYQTLTPADIQAIRELPLSLDFSVRDHQRLRAVHASLGGIRVGIYPNHKLQDLLELIDQEANLFLVGHTHQALVRDVNGTLVINAGSIGLPFDGNNRAGYVQITSHNNHWEGKIIRIKYDLEAAIEDFYSTGFIPEGGPLAGLVLTELKIAWPQLAQWFRKYERLVINQEIRLEDAVNEYLLNPNTT